MESAKALAKLLAREQSNHTVHLANVECEADWHYANLNVKCVPVVEATSYQPNELIDELLFGSGSQPTLDQMNSIWTQLHSDGTCSRNDTIRKQWYRKLNKLFNRLSIESSRTDSQSRQVYSKYLQLIERSPLLFNWTVLPSDRGRFQFKQDVIEVVVTPIAHWNHTERSEFEDSIQLRATSSSSTSVNEFHLVTTWIHSNQSEDPKTTTDYLVNSNVISVNLVNAATRSTIHDATIRLR